MSNSMHFGAKLRFLYRVWRYRWRVETAEVSFLLKNVSPGDTCLDIGGHKGAFTYWMQKQVGPSGKVYTFEPQPELADYLQAAKEAFHFHNVKIVHAAVSATPGECQLFRPSDAATPAATLERRDDSNSFVTVPMVSLDHYFQNVDRGPVRFIKCDVEGHEWDVFRGAESILKQDRPILLFECEQRHHDRSCIGDVFEYLMSIGYEGRFFQHGRLTEWSQFQPERNAHGQPGYVYNFVFRHHDDLEVNESKSSRAA